MICMTFILNLSRVELAGVYSPIIRYKGAF
jgi:hypothetical protein